VPKPERACPVFVYLFQFLTFLVVFIAAIPTLTLGWLTAPFVKTVALELPKAYRSSWQQVVRYSLHPPADARIEFTTLRLFPFPRTTAVYLSELRALPSARGRFANIERVKTKELEKLYQQKSWWRKILQFVNEPRWKFYVKEGRAYTMRTGYAGIWENIAHEIARNSGKVGKDINAQRAIEKQARLKAAHKRWTTR
jgi:hypothetical protein